MNSPLHTSTASDKATWTTTSVGRNEKRRPFVRSPAARSPFEDRNDVRIRRVPGGCKAEDQPRRQRDHGREDQRVNRA